MKKSLASLTMVCLVVKLFAQQNVLHDVDNHYNESNSFLIEQNVAWYEDLRDSEPKSVTASRIIKHGENFRSEGLGNVLIISKGLVLKLNPVTKTIFLDSATSEAIADISSSHLIRQANEADTVITERLENGLLRIRLAKWTDAHAAMEYLVDPDQNLILSMQQWDMRSNKNSKRGEVFPMSITTVENVAFDYKSNRADFDLTQFLKLENGELMPVENYQGFLLVNPKNIKTL